MSETRNNQTSVIRGVTIKLSTPWCCVVAIVVAGLDYIFSKDSDLAHRKPGYVEITCCEPSLFKLWNSRDLAQSVDLLLAAENRVRLRTMTKTAFHALEQVIGQDQGKYPDPRGGPR